MFITNNKSNETGVKLGERMAEVLSASKRFDMLVGFFYFSGIKVLTDALRENTQLHLRVLIGMEADVVNGQLVEIFSSDKGQSFDAIRQRFYAALRRVVGSEKSDTRAFDERVSLFIELLTSGRLEVRKTLDPNHAKLYIFTMNDVVAKVRPMEWITGSSNFSEAGLSLRDELNVEISDFGTEEAAAYFEALWARAVPLTDDEDQRRLLIEILRDESVAAAITPFEAYYLVMRHYLDHQKLQLNEGLVDSILAHAHFRKYRYQVDAVAQALAKLEQYHGVIIADVVGLGKSVIAGLLAAVRMKRGLILCPPGLMGDANGTTGGWHAYVQDFGLIHWKVWSSGNLEALQELLRRDSDFDMVIVDEAHRFRNEETESYAMLKNVCFGKEVVLLTATPYNNRPGDLLSLLHLFSSGKDSPFVPGGDLDGVFKKFTKNNIVISQLRRAVARQDWNAIMPLLPKVGVEILGVRKGKDLDKVRRIAARKGEALNKKIRQIMDKIVIRRNRIDLMTDPDYAKEITTLSTVRPPEAQFFELTAEQDKFYDRVIHDYFGEDGEFRGAVYRPQEYLKNKEGQDDAQNNLFVMMRNLLVMRFESSFGSFRQTLVNMAQILEMTLVFIDRMKVFIYSRRDIERILEETDSEVAYKMLLEAAVALEERYRQGKRQKYADVLYRINDPAFDGGRFVADVKGDLALFEKLIREMDKLKLVENDPKTDAMIRVARQILAGEFEPHAETADVPRKVLLFSVYGDTIKYLQEAVEAAFPGRVLSVTGENFTAAMARTVKENFDASFETQSNDYDILLATDKLSEGFNLNRAGVVINYDIPWNPTRVIQRVGRINRIGKKVFDNLYILNFFPTVQGSQVAQNREVAQIKMFAIHAILGEDSQIFSVEEEPSPAALFDKLCRLDDEAATSFYAQVKRTFAEATAFLEANHPDELRRLRQYPFRVKTAFAGNPPGTFMFRRQGANFYVLVHNPEAGNVSPWTLEDAMRAIACTYETKRISLSPSFWSGGKDEKGKRVSGIYEELKAYEPEKGGGGNGVSASMQAIVNIDNAIPSFSEEDRVFAKDVIEDLQSYGTIAPYTVKLLANAKTSEGVGGILGDIRAFRGCNYLARLRTETTHNEVIVTIEKR